MADLHILIQAIDADIANVRTQDGRILVTGCGNGSGDAFSATELLLASLGSCIAASIAPLLERHGEARNLAIDLQLAGASLPGLIKVDVRVPQADEALALRCRRAAEKCPVLRSLAAPVEIEVTRTP